MTRDRALLAAAGALALAGAVAGGGPGLLRAQQPAFRGAVELVTLNVTVTDGAQRHVAGLTADEFLVLEDGRQQRVAHFAQTAAPLGVALLLDSSASMDGTLPVAQRAATGFVRTLGSADAALVIDFDSRAHVRQVFTSDVALLEAAIRQTRAGGSTALYNALYIALNELQNASGAGGSRGARHGRGAGDEAPAGSERRRRCAIVVLSDGDDTSSLVSFDQVLDLAARSETTIYAIGLLERGERGGKSNDAKFVLRHLAEQTGGRAFFPRDAGTFGDIYREIRAELSAQYSLAYESDNPRTDGQYRRIAVRIARPGVVARTRAGYFAPQR